MIEQIKVGFDNFFYVIYCDVSKKAAIVDPGYDSNKILRFVKDMSLNVCYVINTHYHFDHINENQSIKNSTFSKVVASKIDGKNISSGVDIFIDDNDFLDIGNVKLKFILTPGHTPGGICIIVDNEAIITGDTLFIGDCGRTDLASGDIKAMFNSLHEIIYNLQDNLIVYPGHDYGDKPFDTLGNQKKYNKTLYVKDFNDFLKL
jgi:glyoxylase-like metal-dependent hydrolase (beta-lactamase superfamily II)